MGTGVFSGGGIVEFAAALYGTDDDPTDTVIMRDGVLHGLHHAADSMGQVRVNYMPIGNAVSEGQDEFETIETPANTLDYYLVGGSPFGEWPLTLRADGSAYKLRIRIAGSVGATPNNGTFRVVIGPSRALRDSEVEEALDSTFEAVFTTTTATWETSGASQGASSSATLLTISAGQVRDWVRDVGVYNAVSSASDNSVQQCLVAAHVYAKTNNVARLPQLNALHIQEFVG
jgi:hypothetical protein